MSSILKALRKVEEEKRTSAHVAPDLRSDQGASAPVKKTVGSLLMGMLLGVVCVVLFLAVMPDNEEVSSPPVIVQEEKVVTSPPEPVTVQPAAETIPVVTMPPEPVSIKTPVKVVKKAAVAESKKIEPKVVKETKPVTPRVKDTPELAASPSAQPKQPALPQNVSLVVSEIFFQDNPADRMAVVNDLPVMTGTPVDGALVQEIHSDHVIFKIDEDNYPVYLSPQ